MASKIAANSVTELRALSRKPMTKYAQCIRVTAVRTVFELESLILMGKLCDKIQGNQNVAAINLDLSNGSRERAASTL